MGKRTKIQSNRLDNNIVKDFQIDWGITAGDINAEDMPITNSSGRFNATTVEETLNELNLPVGTILMFDAENSSGSSGNSGIWVDDVTAKGWYACIAANSDKSCPDLTDKFVMGKVVAGSGATGGSNTHTITTSELPPHTHTINHDHPSASNAAVSNGSHRHSITNDTGTNDTQVRHGGSGTDGTAYTNYAGTHTHNVNLPNFTGSSGDGGFSNDSIDIRPAHYSVIYIRKCY